MATTAKQNINRAPKGSRMDNGVEILRNPKVAPQKKKKERKGLAALFYPHGSMDYVFIIILIALCVFGIVMMYSASYMWALEDHNDASYYLKTQLVAAGLGVVAMLFISCLDYRILKNRTLIYAAFIATSVLMLYTSLFGIERNGAKRWLDLKVIEFQPSEIMKFMLVVTFAYLIASNFKKFSSMWYSVFPFAAVLMIVCILMATQRHISGLMIMGAIGVSMMIVGGIPNKHIIRLAVIIIVVGAVGIGLLALTGKFNYIATRVENWRDPFKDVQNTGWQTCQSLIAIGSGGISGVGFGQSKQKFLYLSESHNDFIFAIVCEELGLLGAGIVILLFVLFVFRGFHIAAHAPDKFGMMLVFGLTMQIAIQAFLNIAVACNALPNTGVSLPFFSYGGTALVMQLAQMGLILAVSRHSETSE